MAVRTITYTVTADGVSPASIQSAGVQNDMNVTELLFYLSSELLDKINAEEEEKGGFTYYRFDCVDGAGGKFSTDPSLLGLNEDETPITFLISERLTRYGGNVSVCLVLTRIGKNEQGEDVTEAEMYCHPVNIRLKALPQGHHTDGGDRESITTLAENTKAAAEAASISAQDAEKSAQNAKIAGAEINEDGMLVIHYYGGDVQVGPVKGDPGPQGIQGIQGEKGEKGDKGDKGDKGADAVTDPTYSPTSPNAQSGIAVEEAVRPKQDFFALVSQGDTLFKKILTLINHTTFDASSGLAINSANGEISLDGKKIKLSSAELMELYANVGLFGSLTFPYGNGLINNLATPTGTDPSQAVNVQYVAQHTSKERRMKLIADHTVTAEEASKGEAWELSMSKQNNGIPLDKVHIVYDIPNSTTITSKTTISAKINGGSDLGSYLNFVTVNQNAYGSFWVEAEKIAENKWRNVRAQINSNITNSPLYANYFLGSVDVINSIIISGIAFEGINIKIWGRDAI